MLINEAAEKVGMTKRAIKYYEEQRLLSVKKDNNGYRNYTDEDIRILKCISVYRKLGIGIKDIRHILETNDKNILLRIYQEKLEEMEVQDSEIKALKIFIENDDVTKADEFLDYQTIFSAIESLIPGEWSDYFKNHFRPFLNVRIKTAEQRQALKNLLEYCDETTIKIPAVMKLGVNLAGGVARETKTADEMISYYRDMTEADYEALKAAALKGAKLKVGLLKYHPSYVAQRRMQKEFQNKGYNDIFIKNLKILSPQYREYKDALDKVNDRICQELGMYYDSDYNLVFKNSSKKREQRH